MNNKLSVHRLFRIGNAHYIVDIERQVLEEFQRPQNVISFIEDMRDLQTHYELRFDPKTHRAAAKHLPDEQVQLISVPQLTALDPYQMAKKYGCSEESLKDKPDFEVIVNQEALALRRTGKLPHIEIAGELFNVDLRMLELSHVDNWWQNLSLKKFELTGDGWHYTAFYNPVERKLAEIDPNLTEFPDHIVHIKIPNEIGLDPVAAAREYGMDERELLRRYPIQNELKATITPLSETHIPRLIRQNKEKLQQEHAQNMRKAQPRHRPRF